MGCQCDEGSSHEAGEVLTTTVNPTTTNDLHLIVNGRRDAIYDKDKYQTLVMH